MADPTETSSGTPSEKPQTKGATILGIVVTFILALLNFINQKSDNCLPVSIAVAALCFISFLFALMFNSKNSAKGARTFAFLGFILLVFLVGITVFAVSSSGDPGSSPTPSPTATLTLSPSPSVTPTLSPAVTSKPTVEISKFDVTPKGEPKEEYNLTAKDKTTRLKFPVDYLDDIYFTYTKSTKNGGAIDIMPQSRDLKQDLGEIVDNEKVLILANTKYYSFFIAKNGMFGWNGTKDHFEEEKEYARFHVSSTAGSGKSELTKEQLLEISEFLFSENCQNASDEENDFYPDASWIILNEKGRTQTVSIHGIDAGKYSFDTSASITGSFAKACWLEEPDAHGDPQIEFVALRPGNTGFELKDTETGNTIKLLVTVLCNSD